MAEHDNDSGGLFTLPPLDPTKNPNGFQVNPSAKVAVGAEDDRRPVRASEENYESVVSLGIQTPNGVGSCTGTVANIEGYEYTGSGSLVVTAAHCVPEDAQNIVARGDYMSGDSVYSRYDMGEVQGVYIHPRYNETNPIPNQISNPSTDVAIIEFSGSLPEGIKPANAIPLEVDEFNEFASQLDGSNISQIQVNSTGFSADQYGLTVHEQCSILAGSANQLHSDCDGAQGSSGGPNFLVGDDGELALGDNGEPISVGVNSYISGGVASGKATLSQEFLEVVDVLERQEICTPVAEVDADSGANRRTGPSTENDILGKDYDGTPSALGDGEEVAIIHETENDAGEDWSLTVGEDGRPGYIRSDLLESTGECLAEDGERRAIETEAPQDSYEESNVIEGNFTGPDALAEGDEGLTRQAEAAGFQTNLPAEVAAGTQVAQNHTFAQNGLG